MSWRDDLASFDLRRFTPLGWVVFLLSFVAGGVAIAIFASYQPPTAARPPAVGRDEDDNFRLGGVIGVAAAVGFFFATWYLLALCGIRIVRRSAEIELGQDTASLRRQHLWAKAWRWFFLLLMPLGFLVPCGLSFALIPKETGPLPQGMTPPQWLAMSAMGLPILALIGWLVMREEARKLGLAVERVEEPGQVAVLAEEAATPRTQPRIGELRIERAPRKNLRGPGTSEESTTPREP